MKRVVLIATVLLAAVSQICAQKSYYSKVDGVVGGETLKTALHSLIKDMTPVEYGSGNNSTWWAFYLTDVVPGTDNQVADMYSADVRYFGERGSSVEGMNIEHCVAKSWWGGGKVNAYYDLHHLNPSDETANSRKNNYPLAELTSVSWTNGVSSVGKAIIAGTSQNAYEPADEYKGDFARAYMYIFTCYQNLTWKYTWMVYENSAYPTLKPWAAELLMKWHREDPVSEKEVARNNAVYDIQGNRNPFIDYPRIAEFVWGDSVKSTFKLYGDVEDGSGNQTGKVSGSGSGDGSGSEEGGDDTTDDDSKFTTDKFLLVTDADDLTIGDTIILVCENVAMSTNQKSNNRGCASVEISGNEVKSIAEDVQKIALERGSVSGTFAFNVGGGYLYAASSSSNYLRTRDAIDDNASWRVVIDAEGAAEIAAQGDNTRNLLQYNSSADLFACYKSGQKSVNIYAKAPNSTSVAVVASLQGLVDVYNVNGICVRRAVKASVALEGLPTGMYVVGKEKRFVK